MKPKLTLPLRTWTLAITLSLALWGCIGCTVIVGHGWYYGSVFNKIDDAVLIIDPNEVYVEIGERVPVVPVEIITGL